MPRELNDILKDFQQSVEDVKTAKANEDKTRDAYQKASIDHKDAQDKAASLKEELEAVFAVFVPDNGRVRVSN